MWREFVQGFTAHARFAEPASPAEIAEVERALGVTLPEDLRGFLQETNGLWAQVHLPGMEEEELCTFSLLWSTSEMIEEYENLPTHDEEETPSESVASLLFFASEPNGDPVAFPVSGGIADGAMVVTLSHENYKDRRMRLWSLREYLTPFLEWIQENEARSQAV